MSVRSQLEAMLKPLLPKRWKLIPYQDNLDEISAVTVMFKLLKMENFKSAPLGAYNYTFSITIIEPGSDMSKVEAALDDHVEELWKLLDVHPQMQSVYPQEAVKVLYGATNLAYDITTDVTAFKISPTPPTT